MLGVKRCAFGPALWISLCGITSSLTKKTLVSRSTFKFRLARDGPLPTDQEWQPRS